MWVYQIVSRKLNMTHFPIGLCIITKVKYYYENQATKPLALRPLIQQGVQDFEEERTSNLDKKRDDLKAIRQLP